MVLVLVDNGAVLYQFLVHVGELIADWHVLYSWTHYRALRISVYDKNTSLLGDWFLSGMMESKYSFL